MIVGTAGHIDHGKTALVKALTGVDADRLAEEKARGITLDLGFAYTDLGGGAITGFVDVPGHEKLVRTMLAGAGGIDFALLVVAADDGVMPQTREHIAILDLLGVSTGAVAMTKADLADPARREDVEMQVRAALSGTGLADAPVLPVSSLDGEGIDALRALLAQAEAATPARGSGGAFRLAVDRSFTLSGAGTVVTGMVLSGRVAVGDTVTVSPLGLPARVRGIHAQDHKAEFGVAGQRCALNLAGEGVTKDAIERGDVILAPALHAPGDRIDAVLRVLPSETKPVTTWFPARLHSHAVEVGARIVPLAGDLAPGEAGLVQIVLERPIAAAVGDCFVLRDTSASRSLGGGHFVDLRAPSRKRGTPQRLAWLQAAHDTDPGVALKQLLAVAPVGLPAFLRDRALDAAAGPGLCAAADAQVIGTYALSAAHLAALRDGLVSTLDAFHETSPDLAGLGREKLRLSLEPRLPKEVFLAFLHREADAGRIALDGAFVRLPGHEVRMSAEDEALWQRIRPQLLGEARFRPPRVRDFANEFAIDEREVRRVLRLTQRLGRSDRIALDHFFDRSVVSEMAAIVRDVAASSTDGWFPAAAFRDRVHNGRKVAIEILDFFDGLGLTLRKGDLRRINPHRADLFDDGPMA
ncbi:MAG TPA: selenocysteine-specific translation elongation factor [Luteimonas sp.]|nr:selenocysteine-specific translation elongation factor [Luteimonas sp.]HRP71228.1 selenocysteine-specific translation elongation factor [Luteimonas sp.]